MIDRADNVFFKVYAVLAVLCISSSCTKNMSTSITCRNEAQKGQLFKGVLFDNPVGDIHKEFAPDVLAVTNKVFALPVKSSKDDVIAAMGGSKPKRDTEVLGMSSMQWVFSNSNIFVDVKVYGNCIYGINVSSFKNGDMTFYHKVNDGQLN